MGIQINGTTDSITAIDGSLSLSGAELATVSGVNVTGVVTATSYIVSAGSTSAPSISPSGDSNTGIFFPSADTIAFGEGGSEVARFDSSGRLGIGTVSPASGVTLHVNASGGGIVRVSRLSASASAYGQLEHDGTNSTLSSTAATIFVTNSSERARIDSSGRLLVGTTSARTNIYTSSYSQLLVEGTDFQSSAISAIANSTSNGSYLVLGRSRGTTVGSNTILQSGDQIGIIDFVGNDGTAFRQGARIETQVDGTPGSADMPGRLMFSTTADGSSNPTERMRIDSSGRLLIGTSSTRSIGGITPQIQLEGTSYNASSISLTGNSNDVNGGFLQFIKSRGTSIGSTTVVQNGDYLGAVEFYGTDGTTPRAGAFISAYVDGTPGTNDMPGRLVFSTTADGASSPTEVFRINSASELVSVPVYNNTSAVAANMAINSSGKFLRATSSAKYKKDIETLQDSYADALLNVRPVWYRSTCKADNPSHGYWGFIAEEVAAIDPRLVFWKTIEVNYDENGSAVETSCDPEPEGVQYDRFVPHLLNLIKRQKEQIETQGTAIAALEARLSALEAQ